METKVLKEATERFEIYALINIIGEDMLVTITGGREHIGAIGIAQPRPSIQDPEKISSTSSVYTFLGHKEDMVVKSISEGLSRGLNKKVVVVAGIHWDNLMREDIEEILNMCRRMEGRIMEEMKKP